MILYISQKIYLLDNWHTRHFFQFSSLSTMFSTPLLTCYSQKIARAYWENKISQYLQGFRYVEFIIVIFPNIPRCSFAKHYKFARYSTSMNLLCRKSIRKQLLQILTLSPSLDRLRKRISMLRTIQHRQWC